MWAAAPTAGTSCAGSDRSLRRLAQRNGKAVRGRGRCGQRDSGPLDGDTPSVVKSFEVFAGWGRLEVHRLATGSGQRTEAPSSVWTCDPWMEWDDAAPSGRHRKD